LTLEQMTEVRTRLALFRCPEHSERADFSRKDLPVWSCRPRENTVL